MQGLPPFKPHLLEEYLKKEIREMLDSHEKQQGQHLTREMLDNLADYPMKPLVRIKIEYSGGYETLNPIRFGDQFKDVLANPKDCIKFYKYQRREKELNRR